MTELTAFAPGRVNLIGDHTDHTGGLVLPMAIDLGTTITGTRGGDSVDLRSTEKPQRPASIPLDVHDPSAVEPIWGRYLAGVVAELRPSEGITGTVSSTVPLGAGLSSSASLEVALATALGATGSAVEVAALCQRAEQVASGVPCGIMDQLASVAGVEGHALLIDCHALSVEPVPVPHDLEISVVHSGVSRGLANGKYRERSDQCIAAEALVGPLRLATAQDVATIADDVLRARARHVVTENERVRRFTTALRADDRPTLGALLLEGHASLRDDFAVSVPEVDALVDRIATVDGVHGARMTGGGFGGCLVVLSEPGALDDVDLGDRRRWTVRPAAGARLL